MTWIDRSQPRQADDPPPDPPSEIERLAAERAALLGQLRPRIRTTRQVRIRERIAEITRTMLERRTPLMTKWTRHRPMKRWTPLLAWRRSDARLGDARAALCDLSAVWSDVDQYVVVRIEELLEQIDRLAADISESVTVETARNRHIEEISR